MDAAWSGIEQSLKELFPRKEPPLPIAKYLKIAGVIIGMILILFLIRELWKGTTTTITEPSQSKFSQLIIKYRLDGRFLILGPNPGGVWASKPGDSNQYMWRAIEVVVRNQCNEPINIESDRFQLYVSSQPSTENATIFYPTEQGMQYQTDRIHNRWLETYDETSGILYFKVPDDSSPVYSLHHTLRYRGEKGVDCDIQYSPR